MSRRRQIRHEIEEKGLSQLKPHVLHKAFLRQEHKQDDVTVENNAIKHVIVEPIIVETVEQVDVVIANESLVSETVTTAVGQTQTPEAETIMVVEDTSITIVEEKNKLDSQNGFKLLQPQTQLKQAQIKSKKNKPTKVITPTE